MLRAFARAANDKVSQQESGYGHDVSQGCPGAKCQLAEGLNVHLPGYDVRGICRPTFGQDENKSKWRIAIMDS